MTSGRTGLRPAWLALSVGLVLQAAAVGAAERLFVGVTEPVHDLDLSLPVDGIVEQVAVTEGEWVDKGNPLLALDSRIETLEVERRRLIVEDTSQLDSVRARKSTVASFLNTSRRLFNNSGAVSAEEVKRLELDFQEVTARERELIAQEAREKVEHEMARQRKAQRTLVAPISGVVTELNTDVGQRAGVGETVVRLVDPRYCHLTVNVEEKFARTLMMGADLRFEVQAGEKWVERNGRLLSVSPVADPASRLVRIRIGFDNRDGRIWPGVSGRIRLPE